MLQSAQRDEALLILFPRFLYNDSGYHSLYNNKEIFIIYVMKTICEGCGNPLVASSARVVVIISGHRSVVVNGRLPSDMMMMMITQ